MAQVDIPSWVSALSGAAGVVVSVVALIVSVRTKSTVSNGVPDYAVVDKEGRVLSQSGFGKYGLHVGVSDVPVDLERKDILVPEYALEFASEPDFFEVAPMAGAVSELSSVAPMRYSLRFIGVGFGSPVIRASFRIQAFKNR